MFQFRHKKITLLGLVKYILWLKIQNFCCCKHDRKLSKSFLKITD